ncbi:cytochrome P450 family protein [Streptomyces prunicolor]|uniref:cytochrome P450 family protein n=1 Tax=Streptomyces prunicolor TaxID=67348 RepID=UPI00036B5361
MVAWAVTDAGLIKRLLRHPKISKDAHEHGTDFVNEHMPEQWPLRTWIQVRNALTAYGEEHTRLRRLLQKAFTPGRVADLQPTIEQITTRLLDQLAAAPGRAADLRAEFAYLLPLLVISELFGLPSRMHDGFRRCVGGLFATNISETEAEAHAQGIYALLSELVAEKRATPGDDLTSALIAARDQDGTRLSEQELIDTLLLFIGAGHETTVNALDHAIVNLLTHPEQLRLILAGPATWDDAIQETLRHQPPIFYLIMRFPTEDIEDEPSGLTFRKGTPIMISYGAAGRDPEIHENADAFDITRETRRAHLSFGHGTHYCLGAPLAVLEAQIALPALFSRFPELALAVPAHQLEPVASFISNGHTELPVYLDQVAAA